VSLNARNAISCRAADVLAAFAVSANGANYKSPGRSVLAKPWVGALHLIIYKPGKNGFKSAVRDRDGYLNSTVLGVSLKLTCEKGLAGPTLVYNVLTK